MLTGNELSSAPCTGNKRKRTEQGENSMEPLSSTVRSHNLAILNNERFDVLVIGGGVTGAGVALDAATRGYKGALVEKLDFASGSSSKTTKMVTGGVWHLSNFGCP